MFKEKGLEDKLFEGNKWELPTDIDLIKRAENNFVKKASETGWSEDEIYPLQLGFIEALINAMTHGNLEIKSDDKTNIIDLAKRKLEEEPTDKKVYIDLEITHEKISAIIRDEGKGFAWRKLGDPTAPDKIMNPFGRGTLLMNAFDSVTRNEAGNEVTLIKERSQP